MKKIFIPSLTFIFILFGCMNIFARETKRLNDQPSFQEQSINLQSCITLTLNLDNSPEETSWSIVDANGIAVAGGSNYTSSDSTVVINECLPYGCYNFVIKDTAGNGICCASGNGSYTLVDDATGSILAAGRVFRSIKSTNFCLDEPTCAQVDLEIRFDGFPKQTSWDITDINGNLVASSGGTYNSQAGNTTLNLTPACLPDGCYDLTFYDSVNNGMCPFQSTATSSAIFITPNTLTPLGTVVASLGSVVSPTLCGNYKLYDANGNLIVSGGGSFGASQTNNFCLANGIAQRTAQDTRKLIQVYPTLVSEFITVDYIGNEKIQVNIMDINGRVLQQHSHEKNAAPTFTLDVSNIPTGIYFVQSMTANGFVTTEKFIKK